MEDGTIINEWQYSYVNLKKKDRASVIAALITDRYSSDAQLGKLACDRDSEEWTAYETFRQECYAIADSVVAG